MAAEQKDLEQLYTLVEKINIAMLTSRRADGRLVSRPMATQKRDPIADLWFVADLESHKMDELEADPEINLAYLDSKSFEWISVSGTARISTDREAIRKRWQRDWKAWFGALDEVRDGGPDDPRLALILVEAHSVVYMKREKSKPVVLFELAKGMVTGERPDIGRTKKVNFG
ncbi:MAG TPA: pyridoxamine 5'-phosphate oxidase family protein [Burkholderiales bacterium]|nr:pyridoxamine 5'-phosphate oxidase family protein [Burkholderiales bacterium]